MEKGAVRQYVTGLQSIAEEVRAPLPPPPLQGAHWGGQDPTVKLASKLAVLEVRARGTAAAEHGG